jgi:UDP-N-acetyl-D-mannosaminuronic acid dehydrogenase
VCCLGLAFKADVDDLRESPALEIAEQLAEEFGGRISVVEPYVDALPATLTGLGVRPQQLDDALAFDAILVLLVDHEPFRNVGAARLAGKIVYDTRGIWNAAIQRASGKQKHSGQLSLATGGRIGWPLQ